MLNMYMVKFDVKQNDFQRYVTHARFYDNQKLAVANALMKNKLKEYLPTLEGINEKIFLRVLNSKTYTVSIVFDFTVNDVYFSTQYHGVAEENYTANICVGDELNNTVSLREVNQTYFNETVEKPTKVLVAMYWADIIDFLNTEIARFTNGANLVEETYNKIVEQKTKEEAEQAEAKPEPELIKPEDC